MAGAGRPPAHALCSIEHDVPDLPPDRDRAQPLRETMQATTIDETTLDAFADQAAEAVRLLRLLGNEHRLMIACLLIVHGEMTVGALVEELQLSQSALSQHLARMREDGVLTFRREAQTLYYSIKDPNAVAVIGLLKQLYCKDLRA